jgi:hypothetical protein
VYHYQLQFLVCCTNGAELSGQMAADNTAGVYLNGTQVGSVSAGSSFTSWTPISVTSGFVVCPLINVLDIYVTNYYSPDDTNDPSPTAFRAELTNCCCPLLVSCPTNKTVPCGTNWTFDLPVGSSCCGSNVTVTSTGTVTNGLCPEFITRTWLITDACGNSNTCSQMVTVVNANPPVLTCASNKTVSSGQAWSFDVPTASEACCTNLTIIVLNTVTNVSCNPCAINYTRTWQVTDCCTNTATCSQTVTVIPTGPCQVFNTGTNNGMAALLRGATDPNFALVSEPFGAGTIAVVIDPVNYSSLPDDLASLWIGPDANNPYQLAGVYHYQLQFLVCCTNGAELSGQMAADNAAGVYLNNHYVASVPGFGSWTPISVNSGFVACPLINVLDIYVTNASSTVQPGYSPTAFRAELTNCVSPLITCPSNIVVVTCSTNVPVTWSIMATDACSSVTVTSSPPSGTIFNRDTTNTVIAVATDGSGNTSTCSFLVIVRKPTLSIAISRSGFPVTVIITWLDGGILQQADSVLGPWTDVPLATSPYTVVASASQKFYRLRCP